MAENSNDQNININVRANGAQEAERQLNGAANAANRAADAGERAGNSARNSSNGFNNAASAAGAMGGAFGDAADAASDLFTRAQSLAGVGGIGAIAIAAAAAAVGLQVLAVNTALAADDAGELAQQMDITIDRMEVMKSIADNNSGSLEGMQKVFDKLAKSMAKADDDNAKTNKSLADLGLSYEKLRDLSPEDQAVKIMDAYAALGKTQEGLAAVTQLLGPAFRAQSVAIRALAEDAGATRAQMDEFGIKTEELSEKGGRAEDAMKRLGFAATGLKQTLSEGFGEPYIGLINGAADAINEIRKVYKEYKSLQILIAGVGGALTGALAGAAVGAAAGSIIPGVGTAAGAVAGAVAGGVTGASKGIVGKVAENQAAANATPTIKLNRTSNAAGQSPASLAKAAAEEEQKAERKKIADAAAAAEAAKKAASAAEAAGKKAEANAERIKKLGADAVRDAERLVLVSEKQSHEDLARYDTTKGKLKEITEAEKLSVIELAKQRDLQEAQNIKVKERTDEIKKQADELAAMYKESEKLANAGAGRLAEVGQNALSRASFEKRSVGLGSVDRETLSAIDGVNASASRNRAEQDSLFKGKDDAESLRKYKAAIDEINAAERASVEAFRQAGEDRKAIQADWTNGARNAYANYIEQANNLSASMESVGKNIFKGMEDALVNFVTTGKISFKSFAASIIADLARIAAQKAIAGIAMSLFGGAAGASNVAPAGATNIAPFAKGGAFSGGTQFFASGGVVNRATGFGMANNKMGVMGEAGPEAIMPLQRGADGKLGVKMNGGGGQGVTNVFSPSITVTGSSGSQKENEELGKTITTLIERKYNEFQAKSFRPGGMNNRASLVV